jgi:hypothetical protein
VAPIEAVLWAAASTGRLPSAAWVDGQEGTVTVFRPDQSWLARKVSDYLAVAIAVPSDVRLVRAPAS